MNPLLGTIIILTDQYSDELQIIAESGVEFTVAIQGVIDNIDWKYHKKSAVVYLDFIFRLYQKVPEYLKLGPGYLKPRFTDNTTFTHTLY